MWAGIATKRAAQAALAALAVSMAPVPSQAAENVLRDIQIGESGPRMRIALFCDTPCEAAIEQDGVRIADVNADTQLPLAGRSALADQLRFTSAGGASLMTVLSKRVIKNAVVRSCDISGARATCVDLEFAAATSSNATSFGDASNVGASPERPPSLKASAAAARTGGSIQGASNQGGSIQGNSIQDGAPPMLRAAPGRNLLTFDRYAPPSRLSAPSGTSAPGILSVPEPPAPRKAQTKPARQASTPSPKRPDARSAQASTSEASAPPSAPPSASVQTAYAGRAVTPPTDASLSGRPILNTLQADFVFRDRASSILGRSFTQEECDAARAKLDADAWALDAMVDVGFCQAANGDAAEADALLARLLAYTPDNYQALVGRALIAAEAGEKSVAKRYFQEALNALPPIEESNRILFAMRALG